MKETALAILTILVILIVFDMVFYTPLVWDVTPAVLGTIFGWLYNAAAWVINTIAGFVITLLGI